MQWKDRGDIPNSQCSWASRATARSLTRWVTRHNASYGKVCMSLFSWTIEQCPFQVGILCQLHWGKLREIWCSLLPASAVSTEVPYARDIWKYIPLHVVQHAWKGMSNTHFYFLVLSPYKVVTKFTETYPATVGFVAETRDGRYGQSHRI